MTSPRPTATADKTSSSSTFSGGWLADWQKWRLDGRHGQVDLRIRCPSRSSCSALEFLLWILTDGAAPHRKLAVYPTR